LQFWPVSLWFQTAIKEVSRHQDVHQTQEQANLNQAKYQGSRPFEFEVSGAGLIEKDYVTESVDHEVEKIKDHEDGICLPAKVVENNRDQNADAKQTHKPDPALRPPHLTRRNHKHQTDEEVRKAKDSTGKFSRVGNETARALEYVYLE